MLVHFHKQATTTPKVRAAIQASAEPALVLAERFGTTEQTVYKWRHRDRVNDRATRRTSCKSRRRRKRSSGSFPRRGLTPAQEAVAVVLRTALLVSLDDLLALAIGLEPMVPSMARCGSF